MHRWSTLTILTITSILYLFSGFLFIVYGVNNHITWPVAVGGVLVALTSFAVPALCVFLRWYRGRKKERDKAYRRERVRSVARETYLNEALQPERQEETAPGLEFTV